jgi:5-methylcytosine-specific restriction protein A
VKAKKEQLTRKVGCFYLGEKDMPYSPKKPCRHPGCPELTHDTFCDKHRREDNRIYNQYKRDVLSKTFYKTSQWLKVRKIKLQQSPICEECKKNGTIVVGKIVDHIVPIKQGGEPYDMDNLQTLCWSCHSRKSIQEGSRFGVQTRQRKY